VTIPLAPIPGLKSTDKNGVLLPVWQSWFHQLYTYLTATASGGGGIVPASRQILTAAPLTGGGDLTADRMHSVLANGITNSLLAQMPANSIKGNNAGIAANATDLTVTQVTAMLNTFTSALQGLVPASGGGGTNFLRADGTWAAPAYPIGANPTAVVGLTAVNGAAATFMRSDGAPALDVTISPTWSGTHTFNNAITAAAFIPTSATIPMNGLYLAAANTPGIASNSALRASVNATGNWTFAAPSSGIGVTANGPSGNYGLLVQNATATANSSYGLVVYGGNGASDRCVSFNNYNNTTEFMSIRGNGNTYLSSTLGINGNAPPAQVTGWGTPVGAAVISNYNITDAGGANSNTNKAVAEIIVALKAFGLFGA
jgi:hypothetical protein